MDKTTLILIMAGLLVLLVVLVAVYVIMGRSKETARSSSETAITFESMSSIINRSSTNNTELNRAVDTILERYGNITDFEPYGALLERVCTHPNTDSKVILRFQKALITANPKYKEQIEKRLKLGLAERDKK